MTEDGPYLKNPENPSTVVDDLSIETIAHSGALRISAMRGGHRESKLYFGYEPEEAIALFNTEFPEDQEV
jgi:hypothetical protein